MKNSDRKVPVSSKMTNDHSAISPSMNVQWSGKTLRMSTRRPRAPWNLSSSQPPVPLSAFGTSKSVSVVLTAGLPLDSRGYKAESRSSALPEARADGLGEVALGHQVSGGVGGHRQLG